MMVFPSICETGPSWRARLRIICLKRRMLPRSRNMRIHIFHTRLHRLSRNSKSNRRVHNSSVGSYVYVSSLLTRCTPRNKFNFWDDSELLVSTVGKLKALVRVVNEEQASAPGK